MEIDLSAEERKLLVELLNVRSRALSLEIAHTDRREAKVLLKKELVTLDALLQKCVEKSQEKQQVPDPDEHSSEKALIA